MKEIKNYLAYFLIVSLILFNACEKEILKPDVAPNFRTIYGGVYDSLTKKPIPGAYITIIPEGFPESKKDNIKTDNNGKFSADNMPVFSYGQKYYVTAVLPPVYPNPNSITDGCDCDKLILKDIALLPDTSVLNHACDIFCIPPQIDFGCVAVNDSKEFSVNLINSSSTGSNITINNLDIKSSEITVVSPSFPITLPPKGQKEMIVKWTPTKQQTNFTSQIFANTDCNSNSKKILDISGKSEFLTCSIRGNPLSGNVMNISASIGESNYGTFQITKISGCANLKTSVIKLGNDNHFKIDTSGLPNVVKITYDCTDTLEHYDSILIVTNGDCDKKFILYGNPYSSTLNGETLNPWSLCMRPKNKYTHRGYSFENKSVVDDEEILPSYTCTDDKFNNPPVAMADFRFYGISGSMAIIQAANGLAYIDNVSKVDFNDPKKWYNSHIGKNYSNKSLTVKNGDVIAIRTRQGKYALIWIRNIGINVQTGPSNTMDYLEWSYYYPAP